MTSPAQLPDDLQLLLAEMLEGQLSDEQANDLRLLLQNDSLARREYVRQAVTHGMLQWITGASENGSGNRVQENVSNDIENGNLTIHLRPSTPSLHLGDAVGNDTFSYLATGWLMAYLVAAIVVGIGISIAAITNVSQPSTAVCHVDGSLQQHTPVVAPTNVGRITGMADCVWRNPKTAMAQNARVSRGQKLAIASGLLEISYNTGARVILQGPVTFEVESNNGGYIAVGRLTGTVETEDAKGFSIRTPSAVVTDLGTEFGVAVDDRGATVSHVFRGRVKLETASKNGSAGSPSRILLANDSAKVEPAATKAEFAIRTVVVDPSVFVRNGRFRNEAMGGKRNAFHAWQVYSDAFRRDPSLFAYYNFQQRSGQASVLTNVAANGDPALNGIIESVDWAEGRMPGKQSLLFQGTGDHVALAIPQKTDDLSLCAWVCMWRLQSPFGALLTSESWEKTGQVHWQVHQDGILSLTVWNDKNYCYKSAPIFRNAEWSRWVQIAVVYDHRARLVKFYLDGRLVGSQPIRKHIPLCIGRAWIGNWRMGDLLEDPKDPVNIRNFRGRMDELAIFGRALSDEEVRRAFEAGRPAIADRQSANVSTKESERHSSKNY
jgi:hypothetical protein